MKKINIIIMLVALAAIGIGVILSSGERQTEIASENLFPDLQKQVDMVDSVRLENASGVLLDAALVDSRWGAANKDNYPLDQEKVISLLNKLVQAKLDSAKTAKPENHVKLGLQDITAKDSQAQLLEIKAGEQSWQILVGNSASSGNGLFVRKLGENQTWLTKTQLSLPDDSHAWLMSQIFDLNADDLVSVSREGHWTAVLTQDVSEDRAEGEKAPLWALENMPEGRELSYDSIVKNAVEDILKLELDELVQQKPYDVGDAEPESQVTINTKEQGSITISLLKSGGDSLVVYESDAGDFHWNKWVFKISQFQAGRLTKDLESFLQALPEEPNETQEEANP